MTEETIRASEDELLVFISSRQDDELARARDLAIDSVDNYPGMRVWAFEDAPASSEAARERYIRNAGKADFVIWLVGSTTTQPVVEEVDACLRARSRLLPFMLPAQQRDPHTQGLIERVKKIVTWRKVEDVDTLPLHIRKALTDEIVRAVRDPAPMNHDLYLEQKQRESIAETKRLWTTLGVPDEIAQELADDQSIGHKLAPPTTGVLHVIATQGSGKTLAAHRLFQHAIGNRLGNHLAPLPVFLNARYINGELKDYIEQALGHQGSMYTQRVLVIIDGLDEVGTYEANHVLGRVASLADANQNVAVVVMMRSLPGLKSIGESIVLPEYSDEEFLSITSRVAGRPAKAVEIPYRLSQTRSPLFAVIGGTHFRHSRNPLATSPSEMVSQLVQRILDGSGDYPEEKAEPLKKLAVACINSGESVSKAMIDPRASTHAHLANTRLVVEENGNFDFALAIFREWFAARALVEGTVSSSDIDLTSDRWIVPLAIAINSGNARLGPEIMETISAKDPGIASLVLEEVKHNWSMEDHPEKPLEGTALEIGHQIRQAMSDWKKGLGPLMATVGPTSQDGDIPTLAVVKGSRMVTTGWYQGERELEPVIEMPEDVDFFSASTTRDWPMLRSTAIEPTSVWPWTTTKEDLSSSLSESLRTYRLALHSPIGIREYAAEFAETIPSFLLPNLRQPKICDLTNWIDEWITMPDGRPEDSIMFGQHIYTVKELELVRATLPQLPQNGDGTISELWPGPDKSRPEGRTSVWWYERYTDGQLLERTKAIFDGALKIYNNIVERWFPAFNKRNQMSYMLPLKLEGVLSLTDTPDRRERSNAALMWWPRLVNGDAESGVFLELGSRNDAIGRDTRGKLEAAKDDFLLHRGRFQALPGNDSRPATKLAHDWLAADLRNLRWL